jgi:AraC-like DNA-binding protein
MRHVYRELAPAPALRPYVECYWRATSAGAPGFRSREPLVPDLRIEVIFNAGPAWHWFEADKEPSRQTSVLTCIGMRGASLAIQQPGYLDHFAIRFRPAGLAPFVSAPLGELTQHCWDMRELWTDGAGEFEQRLADAADDAARVVAADTFLLQRLARARRDAELALHAARLLSAGHGQLSIERLAASHGVSYKRLERVFARDVGLSPKHFARVARVQRALELATTQPRAPLARLAAESGYADQAHFTREFSRLIGLPPRAFLASRFAVFETMANSGSVALRPEDAALSKTFNTAGAQRSTQRS